MLQPKFRYLGNTSSRLTLKIFKEAYIMAAIILNKAGDKLPNKMGKAVQSSKLELRSYQKPTRKTILGIQITFQLKLHVCKIIND